MPKEKKKGKYANAPKSQKSLRKLAKQSAMNGTEESGKLTAEEIAARTKAAWETSRIGRPVPEMYPDIIATFGTNDKKIDENSKQIVVDNLTLTYHGYELIKDSQLILSWGNRYGLVGPNGCGKSTLLRALASGMIPRPRNIDVYTVERGVDKSTKTALEAVLEVDTEKKELELEADRLTEALGSGELDEDAQHRISNELNDIYERLDELDADTAEARAGNLLTGLGFTAEMQKKQCKDFSGGWLMRIALAKALYLNPTFLVLDEPTNHLDMQAVVWFENYLKSFKKILLLVCHSQDFLNNVATHIIFMRKQNLELYTGNYDTYVRTRKEKEVRQQKAYEYEQNQISDMKNYIARFGHGSAKLAKQAQSKEKVLEKMMRSGLTEKVVDTKVVPIKFYPCGKLPPPVLQLQDVKFHYPGCEDLYSGVERGLDCDSRVCLVGPNGAGKSTLLRLMLGELDPVDGLVRRHHHLKIASYQQHTVDQLPFEKTPIEHMQDLFPKDLLTGEVHSVDRIRSMIGRFGITGSAQTMKISALSDGQRSRLCFAQIAESRPNFIFLDEPTNALDPETIDALAEAINQFEGGVCVVSHDIRLISQVAKEIWLCDNGTVSTYSGSIESFKRDLEKQLMQTGSITKGNTQLKGDASRKAKGESAISVHHNENGVTRDTAGLEKQFQGMTLIKKCDEGSWR